MKRKRGLFPSKSSADIMENYSPRLRNSQSTRSFSKILMNKPNNKNLVIKSYNDSKNNINDYKYSSLTNREGSFSFYSNKLDESLAQYHGVDQRKIFKNVAEVPDLPVINPYIPKRLLEDIQENIKHDQSGIMTKPKIKVLTKGDTTFVYSNPYDSLKVLRKNHLIFDEINRSLIDRQIQCLDKSAEEVEKNAVKVMGQSPKVKITELFTKGFYKESNEKDFIENLTVNKIKEYLKSKKGNKKKKKINEEFINYFAYFRYSNRNFPEGREQASLSIYKNEILLFGGMTSTPNTNLVWALNLDSLEWRRIQPKGAISLIRFGQTTFCIGSKLFIFGGRLKYNNTTNYAEQEVLNLDTLFWSSPNFTTNLKPSKRRNHIGEMIGNQQYLIHGGVDEEEKILNDVFILNFSPLKWTRASISRFHSGPYLYGHTACLVVPLEIRFNSRLTAYQFPETRRPTYIKEKGLYVFGGYAKDEGITNKTYILTLGKKILEWKEIETKGKVPAPRYYHTMNFYEKGNFLIIHGGRNDEKSISTCLNDIYVLSLSQFDWTEIKVHSNMEDFEVLGRCGHNSFIWSDKLIIFGGMNAFNYIGSSLFIINLDFDFVAKPSRELEIKRQLLNEYPLIKDNPNKLYLLEALTKKNQLDILPERYNIPHIK